MGRGIRYPCRFRQRRHNSRMVRLPVSRETMPKQSLWFLQHRCLNVQVDAKLQPSGFGPARHACRLVLTLSVPHRRHGSSGIKYERCIPQHAHRVGVVVGNPPVSLNHACCQRISFSALGSSRQAMKASASAISASLGCCAGRAVAVIARSL